MNIAIFAEMPFPSTKNFPRHESLSKIYIIKIRGEATKIDGGGGGS